MKQILEFKECNGTSGDEIKALVNYYTNSILGEFILRNSLEKIQQNNKKIEEYKEKLINEVF